MSKVHVIYVAIIGHTFSRIRASASQLKIRCLFFNELNFHERLSVGFNTILLSIFLKIRFFLLSDSMYTVDLQ